MISILKFILLDYIFLLLDTRMNYNNISKIRYYPTDKNMSKKYLLIYDSLFCNYNNVNDDYYICKKEITISYLLNIKYFIITLFSLFFPFCF